MARTYLQLVNDVLRELRETEVTTWSQNAYSTLVGSFVNSAKRDVENAWRWNALRQTFSVTTAAGDVLYTLTGAYERFQPIGAQWNKTVKGELDALSREYHRGLFNGDFTDTTDLATGSVTGWSRHEALDTSYVQINVWPVPTGVETLKFYGYNPPEDFTADADSLTVPHRAVVETALARARGERGEDGGIAANEQFGFAQRAAADSIALDAARHGEDTLWEAV